MAICKIGRLIRFLSKRVRMSQGKIDRTALISKSTANAPNLIYLNLRTRQKKNNFTWGEFVCRIEKSNVEFL